MFDGATRSALPREWTTATRKPRWRSALGVVGRSLELDHDRGFAAHVPAVMAGSDSIDHAGLDVLLASIIVNDAKTSRNAVADVRYLTAVRLHHWLDAFRPAPAGGKGVAPDL